MLVVTRKVNEVIVVGEAVSLRIFKIRGKRVRIAIEAPAGVPVHRAEVQEC